jgi:ArsR family transcriptional regulator
MVSLQDFKAELFRTLGNPLRIRILEALRSAGSLTVTEIHQQVGAAPSNVSQHLGIMRARGVVSARREGTSIWYSAVEPEIFDLLDAARIIFEKQVHAQTRLLHTNGAGTQKRAKR